MQFLGMPLDFSKIPVPYGYYGKIWNFDFVSFCDNFTVPNPKSLQLAVALSKNTLLKSHDLKDSYSFHENNRLIPFSSV